MRGVGWSALAAGLALVVVGCGGGDDGSAKPPQTTVAPVTKAKPPPAATADPVTVLAAGDIASCENDDDDRTAALLDRYEGTVLTLGDAVYDDGTRSEFRECYEPAWGGVLDRTRPAPGNHEYGTAGADGYFDYFGSRAGDPGKGWYSYDLGAWHLIALNSNCDEVGGCEVGSAQERWLRADMRQHRTDCTLAYWHHPRFSSGARHGSSERVADLWNALYDGGADIVLNGHEHNYERFAPLDPAGKVDNERGIREFVAGTGGRGHYQFGPPLPGSEVRESDTFGILQLRLNTDSYEWRFVAVDEETFGDAGSGRCH